MSGTTRQVRALLGLVGLRPWRLVVAVLLGAVAVLAGIGLLGVSGYLICKASTQPPILTLTVLIVGVRALALTRPLARYGERLVAHDLAFRSLGVLRARIFERIEPLAPGELDAYRDGELLSRMVRDVDEVQDLVLRIVLPVAVAVLVAPVVVLAVASVSVTVGLVLAAGLLVAATVTPLVARQLTVVGQGHQAEQRGALTADLVEALDAAPELWLCGADDRATEQMAASDRALVAASHQDARGSGWAEGLAVAMTGLTSLAVLAVGASAAGSGSLDPLLVAPLTLVAMAAFEAVNPLSGAARSGPAVMAAVGRVLALADREPTVVDPADPKVGLGRRPAIAVRSLVVERGSARQRVLDGVDLDVAPGERVVVSAPSGSGKTTLLEVLVRFLERSGGAVDLDGRDIRERGQAETRREVLLLAQDPHVFASNLRENIAFARPGCTDEELLVALDRAQLGGWVRSLPDGLDTRVGEQGRSLSGGQRQRLAMARAFLADPSVLLLDEPTAHLDGVTAGRLLEDLWMQAEGRSVVLVTHGDPGPFTASTQMRWPAGDGDGVRSGGEEVAEGATGAEGEVRR